MIQKLEGNFLFIIPSENDEKKLYKSAQKINLKKEDVKLI